ncbi:MAG: hypothetical protein Q4F12_03515 [Erysipelotrichaceae bacterium]|nr:hypothetical protein [Erysipelotrichaceae bacterium]
MKQYNFRLDEQMVSEAIDVANAYNENLTDLIREGIAKIIEERKNDVYYKLTHNAEMLDKSESKEIIDELKSLNSKDLEIVKTEVVSFEKK